MDRHEGQRPDAHLLGHVGRHAARRVRAHRAGDKVSSERGEMSLVGLLVAMIIFGVPRGATLTLFESSSKAARDANERRGAAARSRDAMDRRARALRTLSNPTTPERDAIPPAAPDDLVFKMVSPS